MPMSTQPYALHASNGTQEPYPRFLCLPALFNVTALYSHHFSTRPVQTGEVSFWQLRIKPQREEILQDARYCTDFPYFLVLLII